tara:strand:+ start:251 stop:856 length:606 start_codon:yes stop_codon:yes gene_type:complete
MQLGTAFALLSAGIERLSVQEAKPDSKDTQMNKTELVAVLVVITPSSITEKMLNAMTKPVLEGLLKHFGGGEAEESAPTAEPGKINKRPGFLDAVRTSIKGSSGIEILPELTENRYAVMIIDTEHRMLKKDGTKSEKKICKTTPFQGLSFKAFKAGKVAPGWKSPDSDWNLFPVIALPGGKELQIQFEGIVCDHDTKYDMA